MKFRNLLPVMVLVALIACVPIGSPTIGPPTTVPRTDTFVAPTATDTRTANIFSQKTPTALPTSASLATNTAPSWTSAPPTASPAIFTSLPATSTACLSTDQDQYVYHPSRLQVLASCIRVTGVIAAIRNEADGDLHLLLRLVHEFANLLTPANANESGDLVIEPVCVKSVTQADAIAVCASDPDPFGGPFPTVGQHIWMEGRYVLDADHGSWAELHPLYRWGPEGALPVNTIAPTSAIATNTAVAGGVTQPPQATAVAGFTLVSLSSPVSVGGNAQVTIQAVPGASCSIRYVTPHGTVSKAQGLGTETADSTGTCAWTWKIGASTEPGTGTVMITANGATQSFPIVIQ
jgi:hypothetical protein